MNAKTLRGFTLLELMIVVVVIGILAAIAYPMYTEQIRKAGRAEGKSALLKAAQLQERNYTVSIPPAYTDLVGNLYGGALAGKKSISSAEDPTVPGKYLITAVTSTVGGAADQAYILTATPTAPFTDPICGNLTLTNTGVRGYSIVATPREQCW